MFTGFVCIKKVNSNEWIGCTTASASLNLDLVQEACALCREYRCRVVCKTCK